MKKLITLTLIIAMLALTGCGKKDDTAPAAEGTDAGTTQTEATENKGATTDINSEDFYDLAEKIEEAEANGDDEAKQEYLAEMQEYLEEIEAASKNLE